MLWPGGCEMADVEGVDSCGAVGGGGGGSDGLGRDVLGDRWHGFIYWMKQLTSSILVFGKLV